MKLTILLLTLLMISQFDSFGKVHIRPKVEIKRISYDSGKTWIIVNDTSCNSKLSAIRKVSAIRNFRLKVGGREFLSTNAGNSWVELVQASKIDKIFRSCSQVNINLKQSCSTVNLRIYSLTGKLLHEKEYFNTSSITFDGIGGNDVMILIALTLEDKETEIIKLWL